MLTKDRVPVIFHDFEIGILGNNQKDEKQPLATKISDLTLEQLKTLYTTGTDSDEYKKGQTNNSGMRKVRARAKRAYLRTSETRGQFARAKRAYLRDELKPYSLANLYSLA